ncbi:MAG: hypothetical protein HWE07_12230 [Cytophagia bacterium]|nr:hypothetical protein [Cytophagia bacterium]
MEQNKIGKYFTYALGEIILVVIGILIAIQLNEWNQGILEDKDFLVRTCSADIYYFGL